MGILRKTSKLNISKTGVFSDLTEGFSLHIDLLENWLVRIAIVNNDNKDKGRTWMISPFGEDNWEGRDRLSTHGFSCPEFESSNAGLVGEQIQVTIEPEPLRLVVKQKIKDSWTTLFEDRTSGAYQWFGKNNRFKYFQAMPGDDHHYGLGDKSGPLDRSGRRLRVLQSDALGYDAEISDPLYKHAPWFMAINHGIGGGLLFDTMAETSFDFGAEHSNYFERYRHVEFSEKAMVLYVVAGPYPKDIVPRLHALTGMPAFPPRWSTGFAFTTMHHADSPNAQSVITQFANEARERKLPISAIHLGSGYTAGEDGLRYVFNWNTNRFPERNRFFEELKAMGYRTCANIKPVLMTGHFAFPKATEQGWFIRAGNGNSAIERFWDGWGANLDFTNPDSIKWWQDGVENQVLGAGFDAVWNDNNEAELWDEEAEISGFGKPLPAIDHKPVHALLMTRASYEATLNRKLEERPYTISRAGPIGISRYGETWSGDNRTSWHTLKWNLRQGLSMSLSAMPLVGHDIGGFDGPPPDGELLLRWFQMMALHPRCVMNSWKAEYDNIPNLPWMHAEAFEGIKKALNLRYRFLPVIYSLMYHAHKTGHPIIAPTFYHYNDPRCHKDSDTFLLGQNILVAPVVHQDQRSVECYLPDKTTRWIEFHTGNSFEGGQLVKIDAPVDELAIFVRSGSILPLATRWPCHEPHNADHVQLVGFTGSQTGMGTEEITFDDGISWGFQKQDYSRLSVQLIWDEQSACIDVVELASGKGRPEISCRLLYNDQRKFAVKTNFE